MGSLPQKVRNLERHQRIELVVEEGHCKLLRRIICSHLRRLENLSGNLVMPAHAVADKASAARRVNIQLLLPL